MSATRVSSQHVTKGHTAMVQHRAFQAPPTAEIPHSEGPFLGFTYLGISSESDHLRDYQREAQDHEHHEQTRLKKLRNPRNVVDMFLSCEYQKYIEG